MPTTRSTTTDITNIPTSQTRTRQQTTGPKKRARDCDNIPLQVGDIVNFVTDLKGLKGKSGTVNKVQKTRVQVTVIHTNGRKTTESRKSTNLRRTCSKQRIRQLLGSCNRFINTEGVICYPEVEDEHVLPLLDPARTHVGIRLRQQNLPTQQPNISE